MHLDRSRKKARCRVCREWRDCSQDARAWPYIGTHELRDRYHNLLLARGYAHYNGDIKTTKLFRDLTHFYQHDLLEELHCSMGPPPHCWLTRLLLRERVDVVQHPLRHLLLITFLGCTPEQVFSSFAAYKPFGEGPWPCLNKGRHPITGKGW
jgi:hypothetical protein